MIGRTGWLRAALPALWITCGASAQTLGNQSLNGKYYFRYLSIGASGSSPVSLTNARTLTGSMIFNGSDTYSFTGQQIAGGSAPVAASGSGKYTLDAGGFLTFDNPLRSGLKINARFSSEALLGSTTEATDNVTDLFAAIPAPAAAPTWNGAYAVSSLEFPGGSEANMRATQFTLAALNQASFATFPVTGHAANLGGKVIAQQISGGTYSIAADGSGSASFGTADNTRLLSGSRAIYISASGNMVLGGSTAPGGHDLLIGVKTMTGVTNDSWNDTFWGAGLRIDSNAAVG